jgi:pimeloyl-ACP methyl ester carboxylesterase
LRSRPLGPRLALLLRGLFALSGFRGYPDAELYRTIRCVAQTSIAEHAARVRRLRLPTLVSWCDDDPLIERAIAEELAAACPAGPRLCFAEGGHNPQKTQAVAIGRALVGWLGEL